MRSPTQFLRLTILLLILSLGSTPSHALDSANTALLLELQQAEPELFERVRLIKEDNRELLEVTLSDVLKMVQKRSITIEASRLGIQAAQAGFLASQGMFTPVLVTSASQSKSVNMSGTGSNLGSDTASTTYLTTSATDITALSATLSKKTTQGITFSSTLSTSNNKSTYYTMADKGDSVSASGSSEAAEVTALSASISVPIFQDWGEVNTIAVKQSELGIEQSLVSTQSIELSLLESVAKTYWTLVGVQENIRTLHEAVALSEKLVKETSARVEVGVLNPTDLKETETQLAANQKNLLTKIIQEQEIEDQIRVALDLGMIPYGFKPADLPDIHGEDFDFKALLEKAFANSDTIKNLEISLKNNQYNLESAYNADKTNLDLNFQYTMNGYGTNPPEALQTFSNTPYHGYSVGVTWTVPLFDKATPETISKRKIERSQLEMQLNDTRSQINIRLQTLLRNLKFGLKEKETAELSVNLAKELLEKEVEKLKIGKSTSYNVSQAQQKYLDAQLNETFVLISNEQTYVSMLTLTGEIYEHYNLPRPE